MRREQTILALLLGAFADVASVGVLVDGTVVAIDDEKPIAPQVEELVLAHPELRGGGCGAGEEEEA